jgi:hypothetical protein
MYGPDVSGLNLYIESYESGPMILLWSKNGSQTDLWNRAVVPQMNMYLDTLLHHFYLYNHN